MRTLLIVMIVAAGLVSTSGCAEEATPETVYTVRGIYIMPQFDGAAAVIEHETIPGVMEAMRMTMKLADPAALEGLAQGDRIQFEYVVTERDRFIRALEKLDPTTALDVPSLQPTPPDSTS